MGWGLGGAAGALPRWPLAAGVVIRHDGEVEANSMSKVRKDTTAQDSLESANVVWANPCSMPDYLYNGQTKTAL
jgi:hypothetical protein